MRLRRVLIVLVPSVLVMAITMATPRMYANGVRSSTVLGWLTFGGPALLVAATAWASARFGALGLRASALAGASVMLLGIVLPFTVVSVLLRVRGADEGEWHLGEFGSFVAALTVPALLIALPGAWIGMRMKPPPRAS